jgi:hypothetical protein
VNFSRNAQASYGFVTDANGDNLISWQDFDFIPNACVALGAIGIATPTTTNATGGCVFPGTGADSVALVPTATVRPTSTSGTAKAALVPTGQGIGLYINGERFIFELTGGALPAAGTQWTLRTYNGRVDVAAASVASPTPSGYTFRQSTHRSPAIANLQIRFVFTEATKAVATTAATLEQVHTVPDPYYVTNEFEQTTDTKIIKFVNLPQAATIRIYSSSGVLVTAIEHNSAQSGGTADWNVRNRNNQVVASGVYFYHIESGDARRVGRFTIVNFAQ